jgi:hypothetical protein
VLETQVGSTAKGGSYQPRAVRASDHSWGFQVRPQTEVLDGGLFMDSSSELFACLSIYLFIYS